MKNIEERKFYSWGDGFSVREVLYIDSKDRVHYRDFSQSDAQVFSTHSICSLKSFKVKAERELSEEESQRYSSKEVRTAVYEKEEDFSEKITKAVLFSISTERLIEELARRGINIATN